MKKVAIVGACPSSFRLAPFEDKSWEIWACSPSMRDNLPRIDVWFEIHALHDFRSLRWKSFTEEYGEWMRKVSESAAVIMQEENEIVPKAVAYPKDAVIADVGGELLTSSIAWEIALAIHTKVDEIGIWGVDMTNPTEYAYQRPGCKYWIQRARDRGIKVTVPPDSDLDYQTPQYGFGDASPLGIKLKAHAYELMDRIDTLGAELTNLDRQREMKVLEQRHLQGGLEEVNMIRQMYVGWSGPDTR